MKKKRTWRRHTLEFKRQAVERMKRTDNIHALARELGIERKLLYTWRYQFEGRPEPRHASYSYGVSTEERKEKQLRDEINKLKSALAERVLENDFLKSALHKINQTHQTGNGAGVSTSTRPSTRGGTSKAH